MLAAQSQKALGPEGVLADDVSGLYEALVAEREAMEAPLLLSEKPARHRDAASTRGAVHRPSARRASRPAAEAPAPRPGDGAAGPRRGCGPSGEAGGLPTDGGFLGAAVDDGEAVRDGGWRCWSGLRGGLDPEELEAARGAGFVPVSLGPRVLRPETAAPAVLGMLSVLRGDLRGGG